MHNLGVLLQLMGSRGGSDMTQRHFDEAEALLKELGGR